MAPLSKAVASIAALTTATRFAILTFTLSLMYLLVASTLAAL